MNITKKMMEAKLLQIAKFEEDYGTDHGQTNVHAMKKYCTDKTYRQRVSAFNKASLETIKHYTKHGY
jgi:hypothetical protein|tara:strand:- start:166 stop:366 length:201 start_codon:yes stop_codon:yes gene_type:complete